VKCSYVNVLMRNHFEGRVLDGRIDLRLSHCSGSYWLLTAETVLVEFVVGKGALRQTFLQVQHSISIILSVPSLEIGHIELFEAVVTRNSAYLCLIVITTTTM
jgi:hypothetical protein